MRNEIQVDKTHYQFKKYVTEARWMSIWHQLNECIALDPETVLEIGPGTGIFKSMMKTSGYHVETVDIDPELRPDFIADCKRLPFDDESFDITCAFQMLEHLPFEDSLITFREMTRVSKKYILISLPDCRKRWTSVIHIPIIGKIYLPIQRPMLLPPKHVFDGEHHWEIGKRNYSLNSVVKALCESGNVRIFKKFRIRENSYHHFMVFMK